MADNRITKRRLRNHVAYNWWKYAIVVVLSIMGVNLLFTTTEYRPPEERKIELYACNGYLDTAALEEDLWPQIVERWPDQEELIVMNIDLTSSDMYATMQFSTYVAAHQGDVCLLPVAEMKKLAQDGAEYAFLDLTPYINSGVIDAEGIDLSAVIYTNEDGSEGIYGIPADSLYGLLSYGCDPAGSVLCVMVYSGNDDTAAGVAGLLIEQHRVDKPEGYDEMRGQKEKNTSPVL